MTTVAIVAFSGYGHTARQAEAVAAGARKHTGTTATVYMIDPEGNLPDDAWTALDASDAIIFGSPTYMGAPAWQFKKFADASSKKWMGREWKDKVSAGFTNSASLNGDKYATITAFFTLAMQHAMIWVGLGLLPSNTKGSQRNDLNWMGSFAGAMAQSPADASAEESPAEGDLLTAEVLGTRVAELAAKLKK